jgi:hypothetical protein
MEEAGVSRENHQPWATTGKLYRLQLREPKIKNQINMVKLLNPK